MRSIRSYLLSRLLGGAALVFAAGGVAVYLGVAGSLAAQFDRNLADRVQGFASILFQDQNVLRFEFSGELMPEYEREELAEYFELWLDDGQLVERSESLGAQDLVVPETPGDVPTHWTAPLPDGREGRYVAQMIEVHHVYPEQGPDRPTPARVLVAIAQGRETLIASERTVLFGCIAVALVLMVLIAFLSWRSVERGLRPAKRLAAALDAIRVDHLPERLNLGALPSELSPVAEKTSALIRRVAIALERERRTTADIAHELRTPISEVLTVSEVVLREGRNGHDPEGTRRALGRIRNGAARRAAPRTLARR